MKKAWHRGLRWAGQVWASPLTVAGLVVAALGGARPVRLHDGAIDVLAPARGPLAFFFRRARVSAYTWGATIVYRERALLSDERLLRHERAHVRQALFLGPFLAAAYPAASLWQLARGGRLYRDNFFERDARRREEVHSGPAPAPRSFGQATSGLDGETSRQGGDP